MKMEGKVAILVTGTIQELKPMTVMMPKTMERYSHAENVTHLWSANYDLFNHKNMHNIMIDYSRNGC
jgi:hypothetical protein